MCENEADLTKHHVECIDTGIRNVPCQKCEKVFTNFAIRRHKQVCKGKEEYDCPECGMVCTTALAVKKHYDNEHKLEQVQSREVCYHWRRGNCTRTNCRFAHVGHQNKSSSESTRKNTTKVPPCKNGESCEWLKKGQCSYFHSRVGVQRPWVIREKSQNQGGRQGDQHDQNGQGHLRRGHGVQTGQDNDRRLPCKFDGRCERIPNCPFIHSLQDFPLLRRRGQETRQNQRRQ